MEIFESISHVQAITVPFFTTSRRNSASIPSGRRPRPGRGIRRRACRRPRSSRRCSSPRCVSIPRIRSIPRADRFVLSKGHGAPILYAAWAAVGAFPREDLLKLRTLGSDLEGHPTPRLPFVDVATGSLGQGIAAGIGLALNARRIGSDYRTYVLLGDGESAEGSVWEAAEVGRDAETRQPVRHHGRERPRPEPPDAVGPRSAGVRLARIARSAGIRSPSTATISRPCSRRSTKRARRRASRR